MSGVVVSKPSRVRRVIRGVFRWTFRLLAAVVVLLIVAFLILFRVPLYNRFVLYPKEARAWEAIRATAEQIPPIEGWTEYRGVLHSHSHFSHDSEVTFPEILAAAKEADIDFIFMSDHCVEGKADYSIQWRGVHDGVLFGPGYEMPHGFLPFGLPSEITLDCGADPETLAQQIEAEGGLLFFAHSEEERLWDLPELDGMEIYNIHTDFKGEGYGEILPDALLSLRRYPDHVFRRIYDRQDAILAHWDQLNTQRKIVGIAASDAHQNNGIRGYYTDRGTLLLRMTSPDDIDDFALNPITRTLLRLAFGPLEPGKQLFRLDLDRYSRSLRFVNTHILARDLSEESLLESLKQGRVFIAFDMIVDARGFTVAASNGTDTVTLGESITLTGATSLNMRSPVPCRFTVMRDGQAVAHETGREFNFPIHETGNYRVEAELMIVDTWVPWVYTNPIAVTGG